MVRERLVRLDAPTGGQELALYAADQARSVIGIIGGHERLPPPLQRQTRDLVSSSERVGQLRLTSGPSIRGQRTEWCFLPKSIRIISVPSGVPATRPLLSG